MTFDDPDYNRIRATDIVVLGFWFMLAVIVLVLIGSCTDAKAAWPRTGPLTDHADIALDNYFYDDEGRLVFRQLIWLEFDGERERVIDWRMVKSDAILPVRKGDKWESVWLDGDVFRRVVSKSYQELHSQYDVELCDREVHPERLRRKLTCGKALDYKPGEPVPPQVEWR